VPSEKYGCFAVRWKRYAFLIYAVIYVYFPTGLSMDDFLAGAQAFRDVTLTLFEFCEYCEWREMTSSFRAVFLRSVFRDGTRFFPVAGRRRNRAFGTHALTHVRRSRVRDLKIIRRRWPVYVFTDLYVKDPGGIRRADGIRRWGRGRGQPTFSTILRSIARRWEPRRSEPRAPLYRPVVT